MSVKKCKLNDAYKLCLDSQRYESEVRGTVMFPCSGYFTDMDNSGTLEIPWHWHEEIEVFVVHSGALRLCVNGNVCVLRENEGAFINSNVLHSMKALDGTECTINTFVFHANLISGTAESVFEQNYVRPILNCYASLPFVEFYSKDEWQRKAVQCILDAFTAYDEEEYAYEMIVREKLSHMWYLLVTNTQPSQRNMLESRDIVRMKTMMDLMHRQYTEILTVEKIAAVANVSVRECLRCFQKTIGMPPMQYLLKYRVSVAARLLSETDLTIAEICTRAGFDTPSYFTKVFKRFMSCTPSSYRKAAVKAPLVS